VFVAFDIHHAMGMHHIAICGLSGCENKGVFEEPLLQWKIINYYIFSVCV